MSARRRTVANGRSVRIPGGNFTTNLWRVEYARCRKPQKLNRYGNSLFHDYDDEDLLLECVRLEDPLRQAEAKSSATATSARRDEYSEDIGVHVQCKYFKWL